MLDYGPWFNGFGENLRLTHINQDSDNRLTLRFESRIRNAWFQTMGNGVIELWFHHADVGNSELAIRRELVATEENPNPGMGISYRPGFLAVRISGTLLEYDGSSGIEDVVYDYPRVAQP